MTSAASKAAVTIVGAGISGVAAASVLIDAGIRVRICDMGENPGGRMAVRDLAGPAWPGHVVDVGAAYFTVGDDDFAACVTRWKHQGLAHEWSNSFAVVDDAGTRVETGRMRWSAAQGLRSLVRAELRSLHSSGLLELQLSHRVTHISASTAAVTVDGVDCAAAVLACPQPQALRLLADDTTADLQAQLQMQWSPVLSHTMIFAARDWPTYGLWFINNSEVVTGVADDGARRGDDAAVLVAHSTADVARAHFDAPDLASEILTLETKSKLDISANPVDTLTKRWGLARPAAASSGDFAANQNGRVLVCGDGWGGTPRIEGAWLSARRAAQAVLAVLQG